jgi:hypothetical protein
VHLSIVPVRISLGVAIYSSLAGKFSEACNTPLARVLMSRATLIANTLLQLLHSTQREDEL